MLDAGSVRTYHCQARRVFYEHVNPNPHFLSFGLLVERTPSPEGRDEASSEPSLGSTFSLDLPDAGPLERFVEEPPPSKFEGKTFWFNVFG